MPDISLSLNNIRNTKSLYVEDLGLSFTVRKLGAGEELDLSDKMRRLGEIAKELQKVDFTKYDLSKKEDRKTIKELDKKVTALSEEIADIKRFELDSYKRCFSDNSGGKDVERLLNSLTEYDRAELFRKIFEPVTLLDATETSPEDSGDVGND